MTLGINVTETEHSGIMVSTILANETDEVDPVRGLSYLHVSKFRK
jgi:hypothetical protein